MANRQGKTGLIHQRFIGLFIACAAGFACLSASANAVSAEKESETFAVQPGESLSNYLRRNALLPGISDGQLVYLPGLVLKRSNQVQQQSLLRTQLLTELFSSFDSGSNKFSRLIERLPVNGRLILKSTDADYLSLHPELSPRLQPGDQVVVKARPDTLVVLSDSAHCAVSYRPGLEAPGYVQSCTQQKVDKVWLVQPTGQVHVLDVGQWNAGAQIVPMPGAWLLAIERKSRLKPVLAEKMASFLATQGQSFLPPQVGSLEAAQPNDSAPLRDLPVSSSSWGWVGLMQTPTARMRAAGSASITASRVAPYSRYSVMLQPFDWLEAGFRYTKITNRLFGSQEFSGDQKFLDKNIDAKFRLWQESAYVPEIALGLNDIGGTALFASEYLVASKRFGNFDTSLGIGWGYLGAAGDFSNPLSLVSNKFGIRPAVDFGTGGQLAAGTYFRGRTSLFGGVQWHTPWDRLTVKLEYDGNNYQGEPLSNPQEQSSRFNYGVVYHASDSINLHLGVERGNTLSVGISLFENFSTFNTPKLSDPQPILVDKTPRPTQVDWPSTLSKFESQTEWQVTGVEKRGSEVRLNVRNAQATYFKEKIERAAEVLHQDLPADVKWFTVNYENNGADVGQHVVDRDQFVARRTEFRNTAQHEYSEVVAIEGYEMPYEPVVEKPEERVSNQISLGYQQVLGGADGLLYQLFLANDTRINLSKSTWAEGRLAYRLIDNFEQFKQAGSSRLPQVRTNLREYAITSDLTIPHLALKHMGKLSDGHYYGLYAGLLEQMFAGVGGEYLYRPFGGKYAIGIDVNKVRQRAFEQDFDLQSYAVNTGHITAYIDTGIEDIFATISIGQYLAGDKGITVDVSREFNNGVRMGAFATRTNVSAEDFGEGSFDKGIYMTVPFSAFFTKTVPGDAVFLWRPLTRDGGAKLNRGFSLYQQTGVRNYRTLEYGS